MIVVSVILVVLYAVYLYAIVYDGTDCGGVI